MQSASQSLQEAINEFRTLKRLEASESAVNSNKGFVGAEHGKRPKRDAPEHMPIEGARIETGFSKAETWLHGFVTTVRAWRLDRERMLAGLPLRTHPQVRRKAALAMEDTSPVEVALALGYTSDKSVRELRIRNGRDEHTGRVLQSSQRPIVSPNRSRQR